jgi:hypothetical protein
MSRHQHHHHNKHHPKEAPRARKLHQNPWLIVGVVLMLLAMIIYVLTMDMSVEPAALDDSPAEAVSGTP